MSLVSFIKGRRGASGFGYASTAEEVTEGLDLSGKTALITGINSGLGRETGRVLSLRGATILGAARTAEKAEEACAQLADAVPLVCELSEPDSVRACVRAVEETGREIDMLICNAGIMALPKRTVKHGQELQFLTNHIGHFLLVTGLLDRLAPAGRVVMLSSKAHDWAPKSGIQFDDLSFERGYSANRAYGQSKLANLLFARSLSRRFEGTAQTANALHPGVIQTNLGRHLPGIAQSLFGVVSVIALKSIPQGAATQCYVATHPSLEGVSGEYFSDCNVARSSALGRDEALGDRLWQVTEEIIGGL
ncbi:MAG TPA: SDR family oxidoreductase [Polyangiaceae bacterium]|nr:SDR family oxidoreductase [Polyangiaceae bacterium]